MSAAESGSSLYNAVPWITRTRNTFSPSSTNCASLSPTMRTKLPGDSWTSALDASTVRTESPSTIGEFTAVAIQSPESPRRVATSPLTTLTRATPRSVRAACGPAAADTGHRATPAHSETINALACIAPNLLDGDVCALRCASLRFGSSSFLTNS